MNVTFLGTGAAWPAPDRVQTGILLEDTTPILLDCGSGILHTLSSTTVGVTGIEHLLITHHHPDHVSDIIGLLVARWLAGAPPLSITGPAGTREFIHDMIKLYPDFSDDLNPDVTDIDPGEHTISDYSITAVPTSHSIDCLAYRIETPACCLTYSGDTEPRPEIAALADGSTVLIHDCSFPDDIDVGNHSTPTALGNILAGTEIGRVYLTHLYPHTDGRHQELIDAVNSHYDGDVQIAHDGLSVNVTRL